MTHHATLTRPISGEDVFQFPLIFKCHLSSLLSQHLNLSSHHPSIRFRSVNPLKHSIPMPIPIPIPESLTPAPVLRRQLSFFFQ